jgi:hypothetical protein
MCGHREMATEDLLVVMTHAVKMCVIILVQYKKPQLGSGMVAAHYLVMTAEACLVEKSHQQEGEIREKQEVAVPGRCRYHRNAICVGNLERSQPLSIEIRENGTHVATAAETSGLESVAHETGVIWGQITGTLDLFRQWMRVEVTAAGSVAHLWTTLPATIARDPRDELEAG